MSTSVKQRPALKVRPATMRKIRQVAKSSRWKLVEAVDAMVDAYISQSKHSSRPVHDDQTEQVAS